MSNNYTQFSEVIADITEEEKDWIKRQLDTSWVFGDKEYDEDEFPIELNPADADWTGVRVLRDLEGYNVDYFGFDYEFCDDEEHGSRLWISDDGGYGDVEHVAHFVQKFLQKFHPDLCWSLTYACVCDKPKIGEFGGGGVFVTAKEIKWQSSHEFVAAQHKEFAS